MAVASAQTLGLTVNAVLSSKLSAFTNPEDPAQLQELEATLASAYATGLSQSDKAALLQVFERFPEDDGFGVFWSIVHALEAADNYEEELVASVRRTPCVFNALMTNRIVNAGSSTVAGVPAQQLLKEVLGHSAATPSVIKHVHGYLQRQVGGAR